MQHWWQKFLQQAQKVYRYLLSWWLTTCRPALSRAMHWLTQRSAQTRWLWGSVAILVLLFSALGLYWSQFPKLPNIVQLSQVQAQEHDVQPVRGWALSYALYYSMDTLLTKPGGFIRNDISPPGIFMDDMPNWERGVIFMARDLGRAMRRDFSRSQAQSLDDPNLREMEPLFNISMDSWIFPRAEAEYRTGLNHLQAYMLAVADEEQSQAQFYARADNLARWLADVETRLGSLSMRLSSSIGHQSLVTGLTGDPAASQSTASQASEMQRTPWHEVDDVYFEARGSAWALLLYLQAVEHDFADVLERRNALPALQQVMAELEMTQRKLRVPVVMNGSGVGLFANHSLVMANYIARAQLGVRELQELL